MIFLLLDRLVERFVLGKWGWKRRLICLEGKVILQDLRFWFAQGGLQIVLGVF